MQLSAAASDAIEQLRDVGGGHVLPKTADGPKAIGQVLWTRDAYGSRFGVTAAFPTPDGPNRWYPWDIDACGHQAFTVHSAYYPTPEQALAAPEQAPGRSSDQGGRTETCHAAGRPRRGYRRHPVRLLAAGTPSRPATAGRPR